MCSQDLPKADVQTAQDSQKPPAFTSNVEFAVAVRRPLVNRIIKFATRLSFCLQEGQLRMGKDSRRASVASGGTPSKVRGSSAGRRRRVPGSMVRMGRSHSLRLLQPLPVRTNPLCRRFVLVQEGKGKSV